MKKIIEIVVPLLFVLSLDAIAQSGSCGVSGFYINYDEYVNYERATGGDIEVGAAGYLKIGSDGHYDVYGAMLNNGLVEVDSGGVLSIYGDVLNNGKLIIHRNATVHFYGKTWKNNPSSIVSDGDTLINTTPGGALNFTASRPLISADWLSLSACISSYSGGNNIQFSDGGNVPMDIAMHLKNANSILLVNTPTRIEGILNWDVADGNIVLGNQDLIFSKNAIQEGYQPDRFAITNGSGHLVKENFIGKWVFPTGIAAGEYTPAAIDNATTNTMHILVQDYAGSASDETITGSTADGMQRTWNIYADIASGTAEITLQHNSITNQPSFNDAYNFVTRWSNTIPNPTGDLTIGFGMSAWQSNFPAAGVTGTLSTAGPVSGSSMRSRSYTGFATGPTEEIAYFSKSSNLFHPLPVELISFSAESNGCEVIISFKTGVENSIYKFQLQQSSDGLNYTSIATIDPKGSNSSYSFVDKNAANGTNLYRLVMVENNGDYTRSNVRIATVDCKLKTAPIILYPNPAINFITVSGMKAASEIRVINLHGRVVIAVSSVSENEMIDVSQLPAAPYIVQVIAAKQITSLKFEKL